MTEIPLVGMEDLDAVLPYRTGVFLDTSVQVERFFGIEDRRRKIEAIATGRPVLTSSTVFREFQWSMLSALQFIADALRDVPSNASLRLSEIGRHVAGHHGLYGERRAKRILLALSYLQDLLTLSEEHHPSDVADLAESEIRRFRRRRFFWAGLPEHRQDIRSIGGYIDVVQCSVAEAPRDPKKPQAKMMSCDSKTRECGVRPLLGAARPCLAALPEEWRTRRPRNASVAATVAGWAEDNFAGTGAIGQKACWPLADVIIAHECPSDVVLVTSDRDFIYIVPDKQRVGVLLVR